MNHSHANRRAQASCQVCGRGGGSGAALRRAIIVRPAVAELIQRETGHWSDGGWICLEDLQRFQHRYVESLLQTEKGELTALEREVVESLHQQDILARNPDVEFETDLAPAERLADRMATFGGSWRFIVLFGTVLVLWMAVNTIGLLRRPFDPYPYILLNLALSSLAALQAPVIMMSQRRQEARDRARATHNYQVNLKAELEIRQLHQKMDHLLSHQWERLVEIQEIQMELIAELRARK